MHIKETAAKYPSKEKSYTYQDYLELPDDDNRYEIINGELIMTPAPAPKHQLIHRKIQNRLSNCVEENRLGEILYAPCDVLLSETNLVQPDIFFIAKENRKIIGEKNIQGAPDLIIELLSPGTAYYDLIEKRSFTKNLASRSIGLWIPKSNG